MVRKYFSGIVTLLVCATVGYFMIADVISSKTALVKVSVDDRFPAAFRGGVDLNKVTQQPLKVSFKDQFLEGAVIAKSSAMTELQFNQFMEKDSQGKNSLSCLVYDKVKITFEADGMAVSGQKPQFEVETPCSFNGENLAKMNAIKIPVNLLTKETAESGEFAYDSTPGTIYRLKFALGEWPKSWFMKSVSFVSESGKQEVFYTDQFIQESGADSARHLFMTW